MQNEKFAPNFEAAKFEDADRKLIERFFTNLDKWLVYAVTILPAEVIGALCSMASRAKEDLREILLKQYIKAFLEENTEYSNHSRRSLIFCRSIPPKLFLQIPKPANFTQKWLAQFGDDSIAQMLGVHSVYSGISQWPSRRLIRVSESA